MLPIILLKLLDRALESFGPDRLMFGSDWPVCLLAADDYGAVKGVLDHYAGGADRLSEDERTALFGGTAAGFYLS